MKALKILVIILSLYVLGHTITPCINCVSNHASNVDQTSVMLFADSQDHKDNIDLCSPFCYCICCQSLFEKTIEGFDFSEPDGYSVDIALLLKDPRNPIIPFWRPPKL